MILFSLFPSGVLQVRDVLENGYWHARSLDYLGGELPRLLEWLARCRSSSPLGSAI
jgi:nitric oxide reductase subunit B